MDSLKNPLLSFSSTCQPPEEEPIKEESSFCNCFDGLSVVSATPPPIIKEEPEVEPGLNFTLTQSVAFIISFFLGLFCMAKLIVSSPEGAGTSLPTIPLPKTAKVADLPDLNSYYKFLHSHEKVVMMYYSPACPYCRKYMPDFVKIADDDTVSDNGGDNTIGSFSSNSMKYPGVYFARVNVYGAGNSRGDNVGAILGIQQMPTVKIFENYGSHPVVQMNGVDRGDIEKTLRMMNKKSGGSGALLGRVLSSLENGYENEEKKEEKEKEEAKKEANTAAAAAVAKKKAAALETKAKAEKETEEKEKELELEKEKEKTKVVTAPVVTKKVASKVATTVPEKRELVPVDKKPSKKLSILSSKKVESVSESGSEVKV